MIADLPGWLVLGLGALLLLSGFFSASETALFSLTPTQRASSTPAVRALLHEPRRLLFSVLLCNLLVNVLFFAFARRLMPGEGGLVDIAIGLGVLVTLLIFGEILPKTLGLRLRAACARVAAPMIQVVVAFLGPLSTPLTRLLDLCQRMLGPAAREDAGVTTEVLAHVMERGAEEGALVGLEADLLVEVIELDRVRVREIMTPRVDALFLELSGEDRDRMIERALALGRSTLPVIDGGPDQVAGMVRMRDVFRYPDRPIRQLVMPVKFVPEVASALDLLRELRKDRTAEAVVVDEWGGTAGVVTAEDVFEEIVGDIRIEGEARVPAVVPLGEGRYRVAGALSIRDWNEAFGLDVVPTEFETVGGFVTALLGRIPRAGDEARAQNLLMKVHEVRGRRVLTVDIAVANQAPERTLEAVHEP
jgi:CBS domain containing-hemolysin-like protein